MSWLNQKLQPRMHPPSSYLDDTAIYRAERPSSASSWGRPEEICFFSKALPGILRHDISGHAVLPG